MDPMTGNAAASYGFLLAICVLGIAAAGTLEFADRRRERRARENEREKAARDGEDGEMGAEEDDDERIDERTRR